MSRNDQAWRRAQRLPDRPASDDVLLSEYPREDGSRADARRGSVQGAPSFQPARADGPRPPVVRGADLPVASTSATFLDVTPGVLVEAARVADPVLGVACARLARTLRERPTPERARSVLVTSPRGGADKSRAALSLALALANDLSQRVLIVDLDAAAPLCGDLVRADAGAVRGREGVIGVSVRLHLLTAAGTHPDESRWGDLVDDAASRYDWTVVNAPAVCTSGDPAGLAHIAGAVVVAIEAGTPFTDAERTLATIGRGRVVGTLLCGVG